MNPQVKQQADAIEAKWDGFLSKVGLRVQEVIDEANQGLDELIAQHAKDHGPMGAAFSALQARFRGLGTKVDEAWEKIDGELDEVRDQDDLGSDDYSYLSDTFDRMCDKRRKMSDDLDLHHYTIEMKKNADWARRLREIAMQELQQPVPCSQCGQPLAAQHFQHATQIQCPACNSLNDIMPGSAAAMFYQGLGAHSLAAEASWQAWLAEREAKDKLDRFRHATEYDRWVYHQAARAYWTKYYEEGLKVYPGFTKDVAAAVEAKMKHYVAWDQPVDAQKRELLGRIIDASSKNDAATMQQIVGSLPHFVGLDDCIECLVERKHFPAAEFLFGIKHQQDGEDEPKARWVARELAEMRKFLRA
jgi:phage FluMu protein Com